MGNIVTEYMTQNPRYKKGGNIKVKGLMLHSVGTSQPDPRVFYRKWNTPTHTSSSVHGIIGADETIILLPIMETPGQAMLGGHGGGSCNYTHIGIEMCEPDTIRYTGHAADLIVLDKPAAVAFVEKTTRNAVELFAQLCAFHGLDPMIDIISHAEGHQLGIATNHADPDHLWRQLGMDYGMDDFRRDVAKEMEANMDISRITSLTGTGDDPSDWAKEATEFCKENGIINGDGEGNYGWQQPITREAVATVIYKLLNRKEPV